MAHQPTDTLNNRTFIGLIIAQFLAGFNDQAIHASAMFYAIRQRALDEAQAIILMPILFFAPWAIFCTMSGYLADRYSKRSALVIWKWSEVIIATVALMGFWLGTVHHHPLGAVLVLSCVFLMGTHAAFFAPAKYGAMPEILQAHVLSRGNGILESTTFLATIFGTVTGGLLSSIFRDQEYWIGVVLLVLSAIGAGASLLIAYLPPANPTRPFPRNLFKPLFENLAVLFRSRPLALSALGIAFFVFMVAYMRQCLYMHGETRNPRWDEFDTSLVVATVALGVGLGCPLAGYLSGGKVELGLVPLGCIGMILATMFAAFTIHQIWALVISLIVIGFFSGFYMVPLYTLLQHRAPKKSKGDLVATSNFINVTGAIAASLVFGLLVWGSHATGLTPLAANQKDIATGILKEIKYDDHGRPTLMILENPDNGKKRLFPPRRQTAKVIDDDTFEEAIIEPSLSLTKDVFEVIADFGRTPEVGDKVKVSRYHLRGADHYRLRLAALPLRPAYDNDGLPRYLFIGAALMTMGILVLLCRKLPDFLVRTAYWLRSVRRWRLKVVGTQYVPTHGPVILATNCPHFDAAMQVISGTDRYTHFVLLEQSAVRAPLALLRAMADRQGVLCLDPHQATEADWHRALAMASRGLGNHELVAVTADGPAAAQAGMAQLIADLQRQEGAPIIPVFWGPPNPEERDSARLAWVPRVRVVFGKQLDASASLDEVRRQIRLLGDWVHEHEKDGALPASVRIPAAGDAALTETESSHPPNPSPP